MLDNLLILNLKKSNALDMLNMLCILCLFIQTQLYNINYRIKYEYLKLNHYELSSFMYSSIDTDST